MDNTLDAAFWLPTQILNDDDAPAMELNSKTKKSDGYGFDTDAPKALFPFEFPYSSAFWVSSDFSSPVESSDTESDEEDYLSGAIAVADRAQAVEALTPSHRRPPGSAACGCRGSSQDAHQPKQRPPGSSKKAFPNSNPARSKCLSGNPIDDCWRCEDLSNNRQRLVDCDIGFDMDALGGKGGLIYIVTDSSDSNPTNLTPGMLRHAVIQNEPLWITFSAYMTIKLKYELIVNSFKTIDGRGVNVHVTGGGCITLQYVSNIIIHNIHVHHCKPAGNTNIASSPTHVGWRGKSDGDCYSSSANSSSPPICERTKQVLADDVVTNPEKMADWCLAWMDLFFFCFVINPDGMFTNSR
ncbi:hypothetical protein EV2_030861 [Malus domestica]